MYDLRRLSKFTPILVILNWMFHIDILNPISRKQCEHLNHVNILFKSYENPNNFSIVVVL